MMYGQGKNGQTAKTCGRDKQRPRDRGEETFIRTWRRGAGSTLSGSTHSCGRTKKGYSRGQTNATPGLDGRTFLTCYTKKHQIEI